MCFCVMRRVYDSFASALPSIDLLVMSLNFSDVLSNVSSVMSSCDAPFTRPMRQ